ncbi:hypothetical protein ACVWWR_001565 [Bradyrhizobium sp. LM3.2]
MNDARSITRRRFMTVTGSAVAMLGGGHAFAQGQPRIRIDPTEFQPVPIAITNFLPGSPADADVGIGVTQVITNNLKRSGLFAPIDQAAFIERINNIDVAPQFQNWKTINAQAVVTGRMTRQPDGRLKAEFRLWDVVSGQQLAGQQYFTSPEYWRRIAHIISDQIYERMTGEKGYFDSRVVFVDESGPKERRVKRLAMMDQDGANVRYLTRGSDLVLTPRFSPNSQEITYMEFGQGDPKVYLFNIETGQRETVGNFPGMTFGAQVLAGRPARHHELAAGRQFQPVRDGSALALDHAPHRHAGDRHVSFLLAGWHPHLLRVRSRRQVANLCHGGGRRSGATHLLLQGRHQRHLFDAGVVAARRLHRLHQARRRAVLDRRHEAGRLRRAAAHLRLSQRRPDLLAERPRVDVLPRSRRQRRAVAVLRRHLGPATS